MDIPSLLWTCVRRWYVVLPVLALTVALAVLRFQQAQPQYDMSTKLIVLNASSGVTAESVPGRPLRFNPYAAQLTAAAAAAATRATTPEVLGAVAAKGATASFTATSEQQLPIVQLTASSSDRQSLPLAFYNFVAETQNGFRTLQLRAGAPEAQLLQLQPLAGDFGAPTVSYPSRARSLGATVLGGGVLAALAAVLWDAAARARSRRRSDDRDEALGVAPVTAPGRVRQWDELSVPHADA